MHSDKICTPFELKQFAYTDNTDAFTFARFVECNSGRKYTIIEIQLIRDILATISHISTSAHDLNKSLREKWQEELAMLEL